MTKEIFSINEMDTFAKEIANNIKNGDIICLCGDLGSGKTAFSQFFAKHMGIKEEITSPTFNIVNQYEIDDFYFFHFDVYRINSVEEIIDLGYEEYFFSNGICLIEWADLIKDIIPKKATWIYIKKDLEKGENYRLIEVVNGENISDRYK